MRRILSSLCIAAALGCTSTLAPTYDLSGVWSWNAVDVGQLMTLTQQGTVITGKGISGGIVARDTFQVHGTYEPPHVTLAFDYDTGVVCEYAASVQDANDMAGVVTCSGVKSSLSFSKR